MWHVWWRGELRTGFRWGNLSETTTWENRGVDGRLILKWISRKWNGGMGWIALAQYRDKWRELEKALMNLRVP